MRRFARWAGRGRKWQAGDAVQHVALLRREHVLEARRIDDLLALIRGHLPKIADGGLHHGATIRRELPELRGELTSICFLLRIQAVPSLHAIQHALLLLRGQAVEPLQTLLQLLLLLWREPVVLRIAAQCFLLIFDRQVAVIA